MKLRIKGNSIRLRVTPKDLARLMLQGAIVEFTQFSPNPSNILCYSLALTDRQDPNVTFDDGEIRVSLPTDQAYRWVKSEQVGIEAHKLIDNGCKLSVLVEKDFECLDRNDEENEDAFPNPNAGIFC
jgi:hypothetical protein